MENRCVKKNVAKDERKGKLDGMDWIVKEFLDVCSDFSAKKKKKKF